MNRLLIVLSLVLLVSCDTSEEKKSQVATITEPLQSKIVGEWKLIQDGKVFSLVLSENLDAKMIQGNLVFDTETIGRKFSWRLDTNQDPMHLDLVMGSFEEDGETFRMIVRFITDDMIQVRASEDMFSRPIEFSLSDTKNQSVLTRQ